MPLPRSAHRKNHSNFQVLSAAAPHFPLAEIVTLSRHSPWSVNYDLGLPARQHCGAAARAEAHPNALLCCPHRTPLPFLFHRPLLTRLTLGVLPSQQLPSTTE